MSLESKIDELIVSNTALAAAILAQTAIQERIVQNQHLAIEKMEPGTEKPKRTPRGAAKETPTAEGNSPQPADTASDSTGAGSAASEPAAASTPADEFAVLLAEITTEEALKTHVMDTWTVTDEAGRAYRIKLMQDMAAALGCKPKFVELLAHLPKVLFYVERARLGMEVDFDAAYDFDAGDPAQDAPAASESDFG